MLKTHIIRSLDIFNIIPIYRISIIFSIKCLKVENVMMPIDGKFSKLNNLQI